MAGARPLAWPLRHAPGAGHAARLVRSLPAALLRLVGARRADRAMPAQGSDRRGQLVERDRHPAGHRLLDGEFVDAPSQVLDEAMPDDQDPGAAVLLEPAHRSQPRLETAVIALKPVVGI